ncbi:hypothetical protein [Stenotrophomonas indicatrix]|uniref:hypothetical protein n=1 Tax=Stenotrophomonas indicatrix TaxID=2045451 RepID=UPI0010C52E78|nr:hypothetical protein [Stenotrophomonas indicatrix]QBR45223.1 hypothetical protein DAIF1_27970 [Stenotrophomonas indicatrix]
MVAASAERAGLGIAANALHCAPLPETARQRWLPIEQYYRDLDKSIQVGSENGRRYIVFGFNKALASERLVDGVVEQLLENRFSVERLPSDAEQHYIRISWEAGEPSRLNAG